MHHAVPHSLLNAQHLRINNYYSQQNPKQHNSVLINTYLIRKLTIQLRCKLNYFKCHPQWSHLPIARLAHFDRKRPKQTSTRAQAQHRDTSERRCRPNISINCAMDVKKKKTVCNTICLHSDRAMLLWCKVRLCASYLPCASVDWKRARVNAYYIFLMTVWRQGWVRLRIRSVICYQCFGGQRQMLVYYNISYMSTK